MRVGRANVFEVLRVLLKMGVTARGELVCRLPVYDRLELVRALMKSILGTQRHMLTFSRSGMIVEEPSRFTCLSCFNKAIKSILRPPNFTRTARARGI